MTARVLDPAEWPTLAGTELETVWPHLTPEDTQIVVVEDGTSIIGCWAVIRYVHVEGCWVHPDHRKRGGVARRLLAGMRRAAQRFGANAVITGSANADVTALLEKLNAVPLGQAYVFPV